MLKSKDIKILKIKPLNLSGNVQSNAAKGQSHINDYFLGCQCCVGICKNSTNKDMQDFNLRLKNINKNYDEQAISYFEGLEENKPITELKNICEKVNNNEKLSMQEKAEIRKQAKLMAKKLVNNNR